MKTSYSEQQQTLGRHFDAIRETQADSARVAARLAEQVDAARRWAEAGAAQAAREAPVVGVPLARWDAAMIAEREFVTELACTLRLPVRSAETLIAESWTLMDDLPATRAALHPESITARHQKSVADRRVIFEPEADGMASLHWYDSAEKVKAAFDRLTVVAMSSQCPDEPRTLTQLRADTFADLILDGVTASGVGKGIRGMVHVTVPVMTLLGRSEEPGHLEGYGPIDPDTAREIAARAPSFIRILTHPETGVVLSVGRTRYKPPKDLRRYLRLRDETCRWPGCRRAAAHSDLDHTLDWQFEGLTAHDNLAHLCPADHALKSETRWSYVHLPDGTLKWTSPTGRTFVSEPAMIIRPPGTRSTAKAQALPADSEEPAPF